MADGDFSAFLTASNQKQGLYEVPLPNENLKLGIALNDDREKDGREKLLLFVEPNSVGAACGVPNGKLWYVDEFMITNKEEAAAAFNELTMRGQTSATLTVRDYLSTYVLELTPGQELGFEFQYVEVTPQFEGAPRARNMLQVLSVEDDTPAANATPDRLPESLYIITVDGKPVKTPDQLRAVVEAVRARSSPLAIEVADRPWELDLPDPIPPPPPPRAPGTEGTSAHRSSAGRSNPPSAGPSVAPVSYGKAPAEIYPALPEENLARIDSFTFGDDPSEDRSQQQAIVEVTTGEQFWVNFSNMQHPGGGVPTVRPGARVEIIGLNGDDVAFNGTRGTVIRLPEKSPQGFNQGGPHPPSDPGGYGELSGWGAAPTTSARRRQIDWQEWIRQRQDEPQQLPPNNSFGVGRGQVQPAPGRPIPELGRTLSVLGGGGINSGKSATQGPGPRGVSFAAKQDPVRVQRRKSCNSMVGSEEVRVIERFSSTALGTTQPAQPAQDGFGNTLAVPGVTVPGVPRVVSTFSPAAQKLASQESLAARPGTQPSRSFLPASQSVLPPQQSHSVIPAQPSQFIHPNAQYILPGQPSQSPLPTQSHLVLPIQASQSPWPGQSHAVLPIQPSQSHLPSQPSNFAQPSLSPLPIHSTLSVLQVESPQPGQSSASFLQPQQTAQSLHPAYSRVMNTPPAPSHYVMTGSPSSHPPPGSSPRAQSAMPSAYEYSVLEAAARDAPAGRFRVRVQLPPGVSTPLG